ncbi:hypothetical protein BX600DRAFT_111336 [Xylariales sp. PMI_506]|nr:hypothetical protein BX600DRAFT_111336 [Xylariales sp. PMI_506]
MSATKNDYQVASLAAGFTLGFGFLTVWEAMNQTRRNKNPLRSSYIYMIWGEIAVNLAIGVIAWLFLDGVLSSTVPVLFFILFLWVFEVQLLMQIIINRIAVISENQRLLTWIKWGTVAIITSINVMVFCIWIPAHLDPPLSQTFVSINEIWDRLSKVLILIIDAGLNYYFLRVVQKRLLDHYGLVKYKPLVSFNAKLMVVSILMDVMLIGLMSLPNQVVYIQFHPVAYMVKLNIEMSMASLITRLARGQNNDVNMNSLSETDQRRQYGTQSHHDNSRSHERTGNNNNKAFPRSAVRSMGGDEEQQYRTSTIKGIKRTFDVNVTIDEPGPNDNVAKGLAVGFGSMEDEMSLTHNPGHPSAGTIKEMDGRSSSASTKSRLD